MHYRQSNEASWGLKFVRLKNNEKWAKEYVTCRGVKRLWKIFFFINSINLIYLLVNLIIISVYIL